MTQNKNLILNHDNSLKSNIFFELKNKENLFETISDSNTDNVYALITMSVISTNKKFNNIYIMYLLNLKSFLIIDISVSDTRFKSEEAKAMINRSSLPEGSVIVTLNCSPFTTHTLGEFFTKKDYTHVFYSKKHFTPMIDYTKNYFHGMTLMTLLNAGKIHDKTIKQYAIAWNDETQPIMKRFSDIENINTNVLYYK